MKKLFLTGLLAFTIIKLSAQIQGISYQAVIIDKEPQEVPGRDITGNIMPDQPLMMRFSILDAAGTIEYQEEHSATTDMYGMIELIIGKGTPTASSPGEFSDIDWSGVQKWLKVDLSIGDDEVFYTDFSYEELTFVPYAYHRNITATGSMIIDGMTTLKSRLDVTQGSPSFLSGDLTVTEQTTLNNNLTVNAPSSLNGQVTIDPDMGSSGSKDDWNAYPLRVEGSNQGVAIKVDGSRSSNNYFVTFWDDVNIQGRIEGQTTKELLADPEYIFDNVMYANEVIRSTVDVAKAAAGIVSASTSSTGCAGLGACVTAPVPSLIAGAIAEQVMEAANLALVVADPIIYNVFKHTNIGVTYQSGAGDYAEWLPKSDCSEEFIAGEIVGVKNGYISKKTEGADHLLVISRNPIVLGNMPPAGKEADYEKVAFLGQVPVKVLGSVKPGDFIIPSGNNNGTGVAVSPESLKPAQFSLVVGTAWTSSESVGYNYVNTAVGLSTGQVAKQASKVIDKQQQEISDLKARLDKMDQLLAQNVPGYASAMGIKSDAVVSAPAIQTVIVSPETSPQSDQRVVLYQEISKDQMEQGLALAEKMLAEKGVDLKNHPFFDKIHNEPGFKESFIDDALASVKREMEKLSVEDAKSGAKTVKY
ncbi:MAG TPA: hypothetical protein VHO50_10320 [Bacteroidales bacterium]|nr:hypothetical protein [Bacteroidales bacterium]